MRAPSSRSVPVIGRFSSTRCPICRFFPASLCLCWCYPPKMWSKLPPSCQYFLFCKCSHNVPQSRTLTFRATWSNGWQRLKPLYHGHWENALQQTTTVPFVCQKLRDYGAIPFTWAANATTHKQTRGKMRLALHAAVPPLPVHVRYKESQPSDPKGNVLYVSRVSSQTAEERYGTGASLDTHS